MQRERESQREQKRKRERVEVEEASPQRSGEKVYRQLLHLLSVQVWESHSAGGARRPPNVSQLCGGDSGG